MEGRRRWETEKSEDVVTYIMTEEEEYLVRWGTTDPGDGDICRLCRRDWGDHMNWECPDGELYEEEKPAEWWELVCSAREHR